MVSTLSGHLRSSSLDCRIKQKGYRMVRYADDLVVLCQTDGYNPSTSCMP